MLLRTILIGATALTLAGCGSQAVEMSSADVNLNTRWNGTLASPPSLAGAVQMSGSASMAPSGDRMTHVRVDLANATPGGQHPWALHRGQCDRDQGVVGERSAYNALKIDGDGRAQGSAEVDFHTPTSGSFSVWVMASEGNASMLVACANLAPPSR
jgi:hypothetical protein